MTTQQPQGTTANVTISVEDAFHDEVLQAVDVAIVVMYFISVLAVGLWSMYKTNRSTVGGYFLAGRSITWWPIGASLFSSNVGSGHFVGLAGSGAATGIAVGTFEWNAMFIVLLLAWVFLPVYIASGVVTMPEYLKKRFGGQRLQVCISSLYLFIYIFTKIAVDLYAGAIFIHEALKMELYPSVISLILITGIYTIAGGLAAVIYTDTLQTVIIVVGAVALMIIGFVDIGGYFGLVESYMRAVPTHQVLNHPECGLPRNDSFHVFHSAQDKDFPWTGVVFGMPILSIWYWCSDQVIVQRTLAAKNLTHAKGGAILCSYLKILPMFMMVMVGMMSRAKYPDQVGCVVPEVCQEVCGNPTSCSDIAYPKMVMELLPVGMRGLMMAVILSALMSSLTSIFNSSSTLFTMDLWLRVRSKATERELMIVGRLFIGFLIVVSVLWIPVIQNQEDGQLFTYIQKVSSYFQPPVAACFVLAIFWKRTNEQGAFWGMLFGIIVGIIRMILDLVYPPPSCGVEDLRPGIIRYIHYLHFAIILAVITGVAIVLISLLSPAKEDAEYGGLTWWTRYEAPPSGQKSEESNLVEHDDLAAQYSAASIAEDVSVDNGHCDGDNDLGQPSIIPRFPLVMDTASFNGKTVELQASQDVSEEPKDETKSSSFCGKFLSFICGMDNKLLHGSPSDSCPAIQTLEEDPFWKKFVNWNMIVCVIFAIALWIVFR